MKHLCHALKCATPVPPRLLMCNRHWHLLPKPARDLIWHYYEDGQEHRKDPSAAYLLAQSCAVTIVALRERVLSPITARKHIVSCLACYNGSAEDQDNILAGMQIDELLDEAW